MGGNPKLGTATVSTILEKTPQPKLNSGYWKVTPAEKRPKGV